MFFEPIVYRVFLELIIWIKDLFKKWISKVLKTISNNCKRTLKRKALKRKYFPSWSWKDVFVVFVPMTFDNFSGMRLKVMLVRYGCYCVCIVCFVYHFTFTFILSWLFCVYVKKKEGEIRLLRGITLIISLLMCE